jgi:hypothetical protein
MPKGQQEPPIYWHKGKLPRHLGEDDLLITHLLLHDGVNIFPPLIDVWCVEKHGKFWKPWSKAKISQEQERIVRLWLMGKI